ncbi:A-kinase-interacting protein 1 [Spea bombifrons]|uniref:A-kinase-interacting protein 1 n=1 Tax=Spea bombifrons TaxID=233779 RepID=UPI00234B8D6C|nr:A-kinase-interacting protein 1 [Spea bombifrons]
MENKFERIEYSLKQTSDLGREVLERARRREVSRSPPSYKRGRETRWEHQEPDRMEAEDDGASLEEAFSAVADFMRYTTEQCAKYHNCIPASDVNAQEMRHACRFHLRKQGPPTQASTRGPAACPPQSVGVQRRPQDVNIEVAPGTYRISAGSRGSARQTHVLNIPPGHTVGLTFDL